MTGRWLLCALACVGCGGMAPTPPDGQSESPFAVYDVGTVPRPDAEAPADASPDVVCHPYAEVDAPPGSGSLPDPVPGRTCYPQTSGDIVYWCCEL